MDAERILRPLLDGRAAVHALDAYDSPAVLADAVRGTWAAVERTLRMYLRADVTAPDGIRMSAMSPELMPTDAVLAELRRRNLISLVLAGRLHELVHAVERAALEEVRAADADTARDVVDALVHEVNDVAGRVAAPAAPPPEPAVDSAPAGDVARPAIALRPLWLIALVLVLLAGVAAATFLLGRESPIDQGIAAFREEHWNVAEQHFRHALDADEEDVTARLYLARTLRKQDEHAAAAELLRTAVRLAPEDPAVRRELGYLFLDLESAAPAVEQLRRAVELEPAEPLNWVGLYRAMLRAGDLPGAAELLRRAPAEARSIIEAAR